MASIPSIRAMVRRSMAPSRRIRTSGPAQSMMVESSPAAVGPASRAMAQADPTASRAALQVVGLGWPWALALAIVLPVVAAWLVRWGLQARRDRLARLGTPSMVARLAPSVTQQRTSSAIVRAGLATLLIAIAIAGPRWGVEQTVVKQQGVDVVLALDASASMLATDEKPSRLQAMKQEINRLRDLSPEIGRAHV